MSCLPGTAGPSPRPGATPKPSLLLAVLIVLAAPAPGWAGQITLKASLQALTAPGAFALLGGLRYDNFQVTGSIGAPYSPADVTLQPTSVFQLNPELKAADGATNIFGFVFDVTSQTAGMGVNGVEIVLGGAGGGAEGKAMAQVAVTSTSGPVLANLLTFQSLSSSNIMAQQSFAAQQGVLVVVTLTAAAPLQGDTASVGAIVLDFTTGPLAPGSGPPSPVPEPSALTLLVVGGLGLAGYAWRRRGCWA